MIRFAKESDLIEVNRLREQVNNLHAVNRPDIFKCYFSDEMRNFLFSAFCDPEFAIIVADIDNVICGFAIIKYCHQPETYIKNERSFCDILEFGVDNLYRRQGIATDMMAFIRERALEKDITRIELNAWEFNDEALLFYETIGFKTYRRYFEMDISPSEKFVPKKYIENRFPCLEYDPVGSPVVNPENFLKDEQLGYDKLIITFFPDVMQQLKDQGQISLYYVLGGENPVEIYKFHDSDILITLGYVGCPACAGNLECFNVMGIKKVMFCGGGGVLDKDISVGTLLVVEGAIRDEGFSYKFIPPGRIVYADENIVNKICTYLKDRNIPYLTGLTWTTDAMMRETPERVSRRKAEGAKIVEMEQAGCLAIAKYKNFDYGAIIYGGDDVSQDEWDNRSWATRNGIRYSLVSLCKEIIKTF